MIHKVILVQVDSILKYPPTIALMHNLKKIGVDVVFVSTCLSNEEISVLPTGVRYKKIGREDYAYRSNAFRKMIDLLQIKKQLWTYIEKEYDNDSVIWVMSNITLKHLGSKLFHYRYNLHLFELMDEVYYYGKIPFLKMDLKKYCLNANHVITCEYNRAQITKAWFNLSELPLIIENKPMKNEIMKENAILHSDEAREIIEKIGNRTIILYQGIVDEERPIEIFAKAIEKMGDEYAFVVMTGSDVSNWKSYGNTYVIPFVQPPYHLEVTSHASIGILLYVPVYGIFTSPLNAIYCAPNKLFEYSQFGIPMLGNDIPGLKYTIESHGMGFCLKNLSEPEIIEKIQYIVSSYENFSKKSYEFYESDNNIVSIKKALM